MLDDLCSLSVWDVSGPAQREAQDQVIANLQYFQAHCAETLYNSALTTPCPSRPQTDIQDQNRPGTSGSQATHRLQTEEVPCPDLEDEITAQRRQEMADQNAGQGAGNPVGAPQEANDRAISCQEFLDLHEQISQLTTVVGQLQENGLQGNQQNARACNNPGNNGALDVVQNFGDDHVPNWNSNEVGFFHPDAEGTIGNVLTVGNDTVICDVHLFITQLCNVAVRRLEAFICNCIPQLLCRQAQQWYTVTLSELQCNGL